MTKIMDRMDRLERVEGTKNIIVKTYCRNVAKVDMEFIDGVRDSVIEVLDTADENKFQFDSYEEFMEDVTEKVTDVLWMNFSGGATAKSMAVKIVNLYFR